MQSIRRTSASTRLPRLPKQPPKATLEPAPNVPAGRGGRLHADRMLPLCDDRGTEPAGGVPVIGANRPLAAKKMAPGSEPSGLTISSPTRVTTVRPIVNHLAEPNTSALVVLDRGARYWHWTTMKKVTATSLILFDSDGMSRVLLVPHATKFACCHAT
jgi:hypothetical protein